MSRLVAAGRLRPAAGAGQVDTPSHLYGQLFEDVQMQRVFPDGKTFVDALPNDAPATFVQRYEEERGRAGFDLSAFVHRNFTVPRPSGSAYSSNPSEDVCSHIDKCTMKMPGRLH